MASDSLNQLLLAMTSDDPQMRETAVRAIGTLLLSPDDITDNKLVLLPTLNPRNELARDAITNALGDLDWGVRQSAAEMVIKLTLPAQDQAYALLLDDLQDHDPEIRLGAGWSLALTGDERAVEPLIALLAQPDDIIVASAADALGETDHPRAISALAPLLDHADADVRDAAEDALDRLTGRCE
jgi:HEAT repeat protein